MWTAFATVVVVLVPLLWYSFSVGSNSYIRSTAQEHPSSWMFLYISLFDQFLKATVFRPIERQPTDLAQNTASSTSMSNNIDSENSTPKQILTAEYAVQVFIDPKPRIPKQVWTLIRPETRMIVFMALILLVSASAQVFVAEFYSAIAASITFTVVLMALSFFVFLSMALEWGPFNVSMKLHMNPFLLVILAKRTMLIHSSWMPRTQMTNRGVKFVASDGPFMSNLFIRRDNQPPAIVFAFPAYFSSYLAIQGGLSALAAQLNQLVELARSAPELDLKTPLFWRSAADEYHYDPWTGEGDPATGQSDV